MAYEVVMPYHLHMPSYFLETFTEYPYFRNSYKYSKLYFHNQLKVIGIYSVFSINRFGEKKG